MLSFDPEHEITVNFSCFLLDDDRSAVREIDIVVLDIAVLCGEDDYLSASESFVRCPLADYGGFTAVNPACEKINKTICLKGYRLTF